MSGAASGAPLDPDSTASSGGVTAREVLSGIPRDVEAGAEEVVLDPRVAAALRTALDFLAPADGVSRRPLAVSHGPSLLEVRSPGVDPSGIVPASELLEPVGGCLGPLGQGAWRIRVPTRAAEAWFLTVVQGANALAIPWHSVLQVRLVRDEAIPGLAERESCSVLEAASGWTGGERPVVLIGLGLKRALLPADRLVWRLPAEPIEPTPDDPPPPFERAVRAADGETYWVAEPRILLRDVAPPSLPALARGAARAETEPSIPAPIEGPVAPEPALAPPLPELSAEDVEPLDEEEAPPMAELVTLIEEPAPSIEEAEAPTEEAPIEEAPIEEAPIEETPSEEAPIAEAPPEPPSPVEEAPIAESPMAAPAQPAAVAPPMPALPDHAPVARRALVVEDSITARIFLWRMLEQQGFEVRTVTSVAELQSALAAGPWSLIFADVDLPDGRGAAHLKALTASSAATLVALTRDAHDEAAAAAAGVPHALRKPFDTRTLAQLLAELRERGAR